MLNVDPTLYLRMIEQDRERAMAQRALERAARGDRAAELGVVRGGISLFAEAVRRARATVTHLSLGGSKPTSTAQGASGA